MKIYSYFDRPPAPLPNSRFNLIPEDERVQGAQQHFKDDADINQIVQRAIKYNQPYVDPMKINKSRVPLSGEFPDAVSYHEALNLVLDADAAFDALPSSARKLFEHDPSLYMEYLNNPESFSEAIQKMVPVPQPEPKPEDSPAPSS